MDENSAKAKVLLSEQGVGRKDPSLLDVLERGMAQSSAICDSENELNSVREYASDARLQNPRLEHDVLLSFAREGRPKNQSGRLKPDFGSGDLDGSGELKLCCAADRDFTRKRYIGGRQPMTQLNAAALFQVASKRKAV